MADYGDSDTNVKKGALLFIVRGGAGKMAAGGKRRLDEFQVVNS